VHRRAILSLGVGVAVSGCLGWGGGPEKRLGGIRLVNDRAEAHTVDVVVERDDEEVFADEYRLGTDDESSTLTVDAPTREAGRLVVRFRADDQWVSVYPEDYDDVSERCIGVQFELHRQGTTGYEIRPSTEC
jgi:hypothetical protein